MLLFQVRRVSPWLCSVAALVVLVFSAGCARTTTVITNPLPTFDQKMALILQLEDQRVLREVPCSLASISADSVELCPKPDLERLLGDKEAQLRRRAALAIGRIGQSEGTESLIISLIDPEPEVRQMSAFALGLIGDEMATNALIQALQDPSPMVQGRAAQALGRIGALESSPSIGKLVSKYATAAYSVDTEDLTYPQAAEVEAFRLGLYALADLGAFEPLARAVLQDDGRPLLWWWPVAYALQKLKDPRAFPALEALASVQGSIGVSFAAQGLGQLRNSKGIRTLLKLLDLKQRDKRVVVTTLRALSRFNNPNVTDALRRFVLKRNLDPTLRLEAVKVLGRRLDADATPIFIELITDSWPPMRAAALQGLALTDPETFILVLSGLETDSDWRVRSVLAQVLGESKAEAATDRLMMMLEDVDHRVLPNVLCALFVKEVTTLKQILLEQLNDEDLIVRKTAAKLLGELKPLEAEEALEAAYHVAKEDSSYVARAAILDALAKIDGQRSRDVLRMALDDTDWAVRVLVADRLDALEPQRNYASKIVPAPGRSKLDYAAPRLVSPNVSPHVYIETDYGIIQIELAVIDAPLTSDSFVMLARSGFFNGLSFNRVVSNYMVQGGDPRNDGAGGPGYTLRDELNQLPHLRGTVGMINQGVDTGGSQFFILHSPQPQLDGKYTVFGRVINGIELIDQLRQGDIIRRIHVWDGIEPFTVDP